MAGNNNRYSGSAAASLYVVCLVVTAVILFTDKNLQTDFGTVSPYFIHWYGLLVTAVIDVIAIVVLFAKGSRRTLQVSSVGSILLAIFLVADIFLYSMVGFSSYSQFATYLFGFSKYPGSMNYIPGLYDILLALYVVTFIVSLISARRKQKA